MTRCTYRFRVHLGGVACIARASILSVRELDYVDIPGLRRDAFDRFRVSCLSLTPLIVQATRRRYGYFEALR